MEIIKKISVLSLTLLFIFYWDLMALNQKEIHAQRTRIPIRIDGILDENIWQSKGYGGFLQTKPDDGSPGSEKTTVWIAYDKKHLYVAGRLFDREPGKIIGRMGRRDENVDSDWFTFTIDPYYDHRSGFLFAVNPSGSIMDGTLYNDEGRDDTWDGIWESAVKIDKRGWTVEMKIPFQQLRFKRKEQYIWGVNFFRIIKRKNEESVFSWTPQEESGYVSRFAILTGITKINPERLLEFLPYGMARMETSPEEEGNPFKTGTDYMSNAGFDFKMGLSSNLILNTTINPDFGQVEVDPAVINISDQETFYSEKRPFFVEGADIFRFGEGGTNTNRYLGWPNPMFFYSRRIGRTPQGSASSEGYVKLPEWTTILAAGKITGKIGKSWNIGFLNAITGREFATEEIEGKNNNIEVEPFSYYGVFRLQKEINKGSQGLGLLATTVLRDIQTEDLQSQLEKNDFSLAFDGWTFLDKDRTWVLTGWFGSTRISGSKAAITQIQRSPLHYFQRPDADYVTVDEDATSLSGWAGRIFINKQKGNVIFNAALGAISPGFDAMALGYHSRGDLINGHLEIGYQTFHPDKIFRKWNLTLSTYRNYDFGGNKFDEYYYLIADVQLLNYWQANLTLSYDPARYHHYFTRGGPLALYVSGLLCSFSITSDDRKPMVIGFSGHYRTHPNGSYNWSLNASIHWKPSKNFDLSIGPGFTWIFSQGQWITQVEDPLKTETYGTRYIMADIIQQTVPLEIRINWSFTPKLSLQVYLQPFMGVGDYFSFKELAKAKTFDFNYFGEDDSTINLEDNIYTVDPDGPGPALSFSFEDPDFNLKSLRGTIVLRWEYKPGSTFYLVWTQKRSDYANPGDFSFFRDLRYLFQASGDNIFLIKINHRFNL